MTVFDLDFALEVLPILAKAFVTTVYATIYCFAIAAVLGLVFALVRRARSAFIYLPTVAFIEFIRSTPVLVQIFFAYFVAPQFGIVLSAFVTGVIVIGVHFACYTAEVYRAGIESVPQGQWEAARALNFGILQRWRIVVLPQAIPPVIPVFGNYLIVMFKETPLLSAIGVVEVMQTARVIGAETYQFVEPMTVVGLLMLTVSLIGAMGVRAIERRLTDRP